VDVRRRAEEPDTVVDNPPAWLKKTCPQDLLAVWPTKSIGRSGVGVVAWPVSAQVSCSHAVCSREAGRQWFRRGRAIALTPQMLFTRR